MALQSSRMHESKACKPVQPPYCNPRTCMNRNVIHDDRHTHTPPNCNPRACMNQNLYAFFCSGVMSCCNPRACMNQNLYAFFCSGVMSCCNPSACMNQNYAWGVWCTAYARLQSSHMHESKSVSRPCNGALKSCNPRACMNQNKVWPTAMAPEVLLQSSRMHESKDKVLCSVSCGVAILVHA